MIIFIFNVSLLLVFIYFLQRRKVDFSSVFFASYLAYSAPYILGTIYIPPLIMTPTAISFESYLLMLNVLYTLALSTCFFDNLLMKKMKIIGNSKTKITFPAAKEFAFVLTVLTIILFIFMVILVGFEAIINRRTSNTLTLLEQSILSKVILFTTYTILTSFLIKNKKGIIVGGGILITLFALTPSRSFIFNAVMTLVILYFITQPKIGFKKAFKFLPIVFLLFAFVILGKVFREYNGSFVDAFLWYLTSLDGDRVLFREANYIAANLNIAVESLKPGELWERVYYFPIMLIPYMYSIFIFFGGEPLERLSNILVDLHSFSRFGIGGTFYGELFITLGYLGTSFVVFLIIFFFYWININLNRRVIQSIAFFMLLPAVYLAVYSHRVESTLILARFSDAILIYIVYLITLTITNRFKNKV